MVAVIDAIVTPLATSSLESSIALSFTENRWLTGIRYFQLNLASPYLIGFHAQVPRIPLLSTLSSDALALYLSSASRILTAARSEGWLVAKYHVDYMRLPPIYRFIFLSLLYGHALRLIISELALLWYQLVTASVAFHIALISFLYYLKAASARILMLIFL